MIRRSILLLVATFVALGNAQVRRGPAAVTAISPICARIGREILMENGSAADAMVAIMFCEGVSSPHTMGIGGGFNGVLYTAKTRQAMAIIAREVAPAAAHQDMFNNATDVSGILAVAVPGELRGYAEMHANYGRLPWARLVQPSVDMCRNGYPITPFLSNVLETEFAELVRTTYEFRRIYWNELENRLVRAGEIAYQPELGVTLALIAQYGVDTFYEPTGKVARRLIADIEELNGIITHEDLRDYQVRWLEPEQTTVDGGELTLYTTPAPTSGNILIFILNLLEGYLPASQSSALYNHRIIEAIKFGYGQRTNLGDPFYVDVEQLIEDLKSKEYAKEFRNYIDDYRTSNDPAYYGVSATLPDDHGTCHLSVMAPNGDAVSVTTTVNTSFGAKIISSRTGILLNDEMDDFSVPGKKNSYGLPSSPSNYIAPGKRPMSSMCPSILVNRAGRVELVVGAAGGSKITSTVAWTIIRHIYRSRSLDESMREPRLHHQLFPMKVMYESNQNRTDLAQLRRKGHKIVFATQDDGFVAMGAIARRGNRIDAVSDFRRNGSIAIIPAKYWQ